MPTGLELLGRISVRSEACVYGDNTIYSDQMWVQNRVEVVKLAVDKVSMPVTLHLYERHSARIVEAAYAEVVIEVVW